MINNELFGWMWIVLGFLSGAVLGLWFHNEEWLGGYNSFRRRLLRLGHISFIGLGILNILFIYTVERLHIVSSSSVNSNIETASCAFFVGAVTMPVCCALAAWKKSFHLFFAVPVTSLLIGGILLIKEVFIK